MTIEYAVAVGASLIAAILTWRMLRAFDRRMRKVQDQLKKTQNELNELRTLESRLFLMALNANSNKNSPTEPHKNDDAAVDEVPSAVVDHIAEVITLVPPSALEESNRER